MHAASLAVSIIALVVSAAALVWNAWATRGYKGAAWALAYERPPADEESSFGQLVRLVLTNKGESGASKVRLVFKFDPTHLYVRKTQFHHVGPGESVRIITTFPLLAPVEQGVWARGWLSDIAGGEERNVATVRWRDMLGLPRRSLVRLPLDYEFVNVDS